MIVHYCVSFILNHLKYIIPSDIKKSLKMSHLRCFWSTQACAIPATDSWEALDQQDHVEDPVWDRSTGGGNACDSYSGTWIWKEMTSTHSPLFDEERDQIKKANDWTIQETEIPIGQLH